MPSGSQGRDGLRDDQHLYLASRKTLIVGLLPPISGAKTERVIGRAWQSLAGLRLRGGHGLSSIGVEAFEMESRMDSGRLEHRVDQLCPLND